MSDNRRTHDFTDDSQQYDLVEVCDVCKVRADIVLDMVEVGIIAPQGSEPKDWRFGTHAVIRLRKAVRLKRDLDVNLAGIALALDLYDDLEAMRKRTRTLERHLNLLLDN